MISKVTALLCSAVIGINCTTLDTNKDYVHDLERQLNETRSELEKYQALDYGNDGEITALDAQMLLKYYAESLVGNVENDVSGYGDFIKNDAETE